MDKLKFYKPPRLYNALSDRFLRSILQIESKLKYNQCSMNGHSIQYARINIQSTYTQHAAPTTEAKTFEGNAKNITLLRTNGKL